MQYQMNLERTTYLEPPTICIVVCRVGHEIYSNLLGMPARRRKDHCRLVLGILEK
jgi:hypothetical protein